MNNHAEIALPLGMLPLSQDELSETSAGGLPAGLISGAFIIGGISLAIFVGCIIIAGVVYAVIND